jgi:hypothetical protein
MARTIQTITPSKIFVGGRADGKKTTKGGGIKGAKNKVELTDENGRRVNKNGRRLRKDGKLWQKRTQAVRAILNIRKAQKYDFRIRFSRASIDRCLRAHLADAIGTSMHLSSGVTDMVAYALQAHLVLRTQRAYHVAMQGTHPGARRRTLAACMYRAVSVPDDHLLTPSRFEKMEVPTTNA